MVRPERQPNPAEAGDQRSTDSALPGATALLLDWRALAALILWAANDHLLKPTVGGGPLAVVTGKLSDVAGLTALSFAIGAGLVAIGRQRRLSTPLRLAAIAGPAAALMALKLWPNASEGYVAILETTTGFGHRVVNDRTDLLVLLVLPVLDRMLRHPRPVTVPASTRRASLNGVGMAVLLVATASSFAYTDHSNLSVTEDGRVVVDGERDGDSSALVLTDAGRWVGWDGPEIDEDQQVTELCARQTPDLCVRGTGEPLANRIEESTDGGGTWESVWQVDGRESWVRDLAGSEGDLRVSDIVEAPDGRIVVAVGHLTPVVRGADGRWAPSESELRTFPMLLLLPLLAGALTGLAAAVAMRRTGRGWWSIPVGLGLATVWAGLGLYSLGPIGFLWLPLSVLCGAAGLVAWLWLTASVSAPIGIAIPPVAAVTVAMAVVPLILWANGIGDWTMALAMAAGLITVIVILAAVVVPTANRVGDDQPPSEPASP